MAYDKMVPTLFIGGSYCKNWSDVGHAFDWMVDLRKRGVGMAEAERQLREYMTTVEGWKAPYVDQQIAKARERMKPWLLD